MMEHTLEDKYCPKCNLEFKIITGTRFNQHICKQCNISSIDFDNFDEYGGFDILYNNYCISNIGLIYYKDFLQFKSNITFNNYKDAYDYLIKYIDNLIFK